MALQSPRQTGRATRWRLSFRNAIVIMVIVIVVVGGLGYFVLNATGGGATNVVTTCASTSPCPGRYAAHDVTLFEPYTPGFSQNLLQMTQGQNLPVTVGVTGPETVNNYSVNWGDGTTSSASTPTMTHSFSTVGTYTLSAYALVGSALHDGPEQLYPIEVTPSIENVDLGYYPAIVANLTNGTTGTGFPFGWLEGSGSVKVSATISGAPLNPSFTTGPMALISSGGLQSDLMLNSTSASAIYSFSDRATSIEVNTVTLVVPILGPISGLYSNYTWTVVVTPPGIAPGCDRCHPTAATSPHPGTIDNYEWAPGGAVSLDPSIDYEYVGLEVISNVYQSLIGYNGSETGPSYSDFQPEAATCVPGSPQCAALYGGTTLQSGNFFTFVINPASRFYDPTTSKSWPVYPSDVIFTLARTMGFSLLPGYGSNPGWIVTQSLLPSGNYTWDGGIHGTFNNTPGQILSSMFVNDTSATLGGAACPAAALSGADGCITFNATGGGHGWPFFLELIEDAEGGSIEPCGWFTVQGASVPGFTPTDGADSPCTLPGGATSTSQASFQTYLASAFANATEWDPFEEEAENSPGVNPNVQWNAVGSGPYFLVPNSANPAVGYSLKANPAYVGPTCAGQVGCEPLLGHYAATVNTFWEPSDQVGYKEYVAGYADFAGLQISDLTKFLGLDEEGKIGLLTLPTLTIYFFEFNLEFSATASSYLGVPVNVPRDFFANVGLRNFLTRAYPYTTIEGTIFTVDGIETGFNYGGAIPQYMANYYPQNISWPDTNPVSSPATTGTAGWWWDEISTPTSLWYDPELASCTASSACTVPIIGQPGDAALNDAMADWKSAIISLTQGALAPEILNFWFPGCSSLDCEIGPGTYPYPISFEGWGADYPDPTDYLTPLYYPDSEYTFLDAVQEALDGTYATSTTYNASWCGHFEDSWSDLIYWAGGGPSNDSGFLPNACQYTAYDVMSYFLIDVAANDINLVERNLIYNLAEHIAAQLGLYVYASQANDLGTYAAWIDPSTINENVMTTGDYLFWQIGGNEVWLT
ncbi:MAG: hypothetical protein WB778_00750 [Thermoplasmata archaeon]